MGICGYRNKNYNRIDIKELRWTSFHLVRHQKNEQHIQDLESKILRKVIFLLVLLRLRAFRTEGKYSQGNIQHSRKPDHGQLDD